MPGIWALGDVNGRGTFTHTSYNDYEILVAANLLDNDPRTVSDRIPTYALFIDPPLARVGMTEREVRAGGRPALVGKMMMSRVGRARERGETQGFMSVLVDAESKKFLGAALLGIEADEAIHAIIDLMYAGAPYTVMQRAVHIHPTVSELLPTLLGNLEGRWQHTLWRRRAPARTAESYAGSAGRLQLYRAATPMLAGGRALPRHAQLPGDHYDQ